MGNFGIQIAVGFIKAVVCLYDIVTFPVYFLVQQPWIAWRDAKKIWAKPVKEGDPCSPYVRMPYPPYNEIGDIKTLSELFSSSLSQFGNKHCFGSREVFGEEQELQKDGKYFKKLILGDYKWLSYVDADQRIEQISHGLLELGICSRQKVVIFAETRIEWMLIAQACFRINVAIVTLYATLGEEGIAHGIKETEVNHIFTSQSLLVKLKKIITELPLVTHIVYMEDVGTPPISDFPDTVKILTFSQMEGMGNVTDSNIAVEPPTSDDLAILMYTSGSTGIPKGVLLTHKNILATVRGFAGAIPAKKGNDLYIAYLPLAHVLELACECFFVGAGVPVGYSSPFTLTDKSTAIKKGCQGDATLLKPTVMTCVPLILERIYKSVYEVIDSKGPFARRLFNYVVNYKLFWIKKGFRTPIADRLVFRNMKKLLGGRVRGMASGSAPLAPNTHDFIRATLCDILLQGYGLTETAACAAIMDQTDMATGEVGMPLIGTYIKLVDWEEGGYTVKDKPSPRGEIVIGGDCVASGYYKLEKETKESFKEEDGIRWFYTGDIGEIQPNGTLKIVDRKKDLVKLQFGEYVSLGKVESELKTCAFVENICVYGDSFHTYVVALVYPNHNQLKNLGRDGLSIPELCKDKEVIQIVSDAIKLHASKSKRLIKTEVPAKIKLCTEEWIPDSGLVTAAFKLRRKAIQQFYQADINEMYGTHCNGPTKC